jgi:hypothetical protein
MESGGLCCGFSCVYVHGAKLGYVAERKTRPPFARTWLVAASTAANRFAKLFVAASTRTIFAFGAIACAHSMSNAASCAQPQFVRGFEPLA